MAKKKLRIGVLFGGKSAEHEVSLRSAENIIKALNKERYQITLIKINKDGHFDFNKIKSFDLIFPVLHGPFGEDGTVQGLLKLADIPFVGASVLGSAVGMDKDIMKKLLRDAGLSIGKFITLGYGEKITFEKAKKTLGVPMFIKPSNMGSSVGVSKVKNKKEFEKAIKEAFLFDTKVIIEAFIKGREIECSVLGNDKPTASIPGEVIVNDEFYSYETKYINEDGAFIQIPAKISKKKIKNVQEASIKAYKALSCEGFGRVDSFLKENGEVVINEINTIPGFTSISMYPKLWEASGLPLPKLLDKLIALAVERFNREKKLRTSVI
ncbi:MAG: D-alanine--D-alanine ligase family protein [Candidatus Parcubacteria bacterium]|nr:D-alanine--D-alanine ligase family protein [Candidatus Parcubacteria bacterium]